MTYRYHKDAALELVDASVYYDRQREGLGDEFLDEVRAAEQRILSAPEGWTLLGDEVRRCPLRRFPYALLYRKVNDELLEIIAVMHLRRKPGYWAGRL